MNKYQKIDKLIKDIEIETKTIALYTTYGKFDDEKISEVISLLKETLISYIKDGDSESLDKEQRYGVQFSIFTIIYDFLLVDFEKDYPQRTAEYTFRNEKKLLNLKNICKEIVECLCEYD